MPEPERRSMLLEVRDIDAEQGIFTGFFSNFGSVDTYGTIFDFGCFAKTFKEWGPDGKRRIKCAYQHDPFSALLGKPLKLEEQEFGAYHETKVSKTSYGKDILLLIKDEVLTEQSFAFETVKDIPASRSPDGIRHITEVRLFEYGPVTWGSNENTPITGVRASDLMSRMQRLDKHLQNGDLADADMVALMKRTLDLWGKALAEIPPSEPERESIEVQTEKPAEAAPELQEEERAPAMPIETRALNGKFSYEEIMERVYAAVLQIERIPYDWGDGDYSRYYLIETHPDQAVVVDWSTDVTKYFTTPWAMDKDGVVTVGTLTEVVRAYEPATSIRSMAAMLRAAGSTGTAKNLESRAGARHSTADITAIRGINLVSLDLLDEPDQVDAISAALGTLTDDQIASVMGGLGEARSALILSALQPDPKPGARAHSATTTEGGTATKPADSHLDAAGALALRRRSLDLMELAGR